MQRINTYSLPAELWAATHIEVGDASLLGLPHDELTLGPGVGHRGDLKGWMNRYMGRGHIRNSRSDPHAC
jgi:hypothetical protein